VEQERERIELIGSKQIASSMQSWLGLSPFAVEARRFSDRTARKTG